MTDISGIFVISSSTNSQWISLCGHLETVIGNYFLSQAGNPEAYWYAIYYDSSVDRLNECVEITDKGQCLDQMPEGVGEKEKKFWEKNYKK